MAFVNAYVEEAKDGELVAVKEGQATAFFVVYISLVWSVDVPSEPGGAESLLKAINGVSASTVASKLLLFIVLRGHNFEVPFHSNDGAPALKLLTLEPLDDVAIHAKGVGQELLIEALEDVPHADRFLASSHVVSALSPFILLWVPG